MARSKVENTPKAKHNSATIMVECPVAGGPFAANALGGKLKSGAYRCCKCNGENHPAAKR